MFCMPRVEVLAVMYLLDPRRASPPPRVEELEGGVMSSVLLRRSPTDRRTLGSLYVVSRKGCSSAADVEKTYYWHKHMCTHVRYNIDATKW